MSKNIDQIFISNPASSMVSTDLLYLGRSPYGVTNDMAVTFANFTPSITTLGTITSGTWNGSTIGTIYGGTGVASFTAYGVICAGTTSTGNLQNVSGLGSAGQVLTSNGASALPSWQSSASPKNAIYVAKNGNDSTGNGTINFPFLNVSAAIAYINAQADAGATNTYTIMKMDGVSDIGATIAWPPFVGIVGLGASNSVVNATITLSSTFLATANAFAGFDQVTFEDISFDYSTSTTVSNINLNEISVIGNISLYGSNKNANFYLQDSIVDVLYNFSSVNLSAINLSQISSANFETTDATAAASVFSGCTFGDVVLSNSSKVNIYSSTVPSALLSGTSCSLNVDYVSWPASISLDSGAIATQINLIDAFNSERNNIYVNLNGNDATATGSFNKPFATITAAIASIIDSSFHTIFLADGTYDENITIKSGINIIGNDSSSTIIYGTATFDASFLASNNSIATFKNIQIGDINLDYGTTSTSTAFYLINSIVGDDFITNGSNSNSGIFITNSSINLIHTGYVYLTIRDSQGFYTFNCSNPIPLPSKIQNGISGFELVLLDHANVILENCSAHDAPLAMDGTNCLLQTDLNSYPNSITFSSGATGAQVSYTNIIKEKNIIYIDLNGLDSTANGTIYKPFKTLAAAQNYITTNSSTNIFVLQFGEGTFTESAYALKPFIYLKGVSQEATHINIPFTISSAILSASVTGIATVAFNSLTLDPALSWNFTGSSGTFAPNMHFYNVTFAQAFTNSNTTTALVTRLRLWNCRFLGNISTPGECTVLLYFCNINGSVTASNSNNSGAVTQLSNCLAGSLSVSNYGTINLYNSDHNLTSAIDGVNSRIIANDLSSVSVPTLSGGAVAGQFEINVASSLGTPPYVTLGGSYSTNGILFSGATSAFVLAQPAINNAALISGTVGFSPTFTPYALPGSVTANQLIVAGTSSTAAWAQIASGTSGQVLTSTGSTAPTFQSLPSAFSYTTVSSNTVTMSVNTGYIINNGGVQVAATLPSTAAVGSIIEIVGHSAGGWTIVQNGGQAILLDGSSSHTGAAGSLSSNSAGGSVKLVCTVANTNFTVTSYVGSLTLVL